MLSKAQLAKWKRTRARESLQNLTRPSELPLASDGWELVAYSRGQEDVDGIRTDKLVYERGGKEWPIRREVKSVGGVDCISTNGTWSRLAGR